ncbi:MAG TPA: hypothetical protein VKE92_16120, partial [Anaerolineales bacterium]|nr:hypothetical protein [Anaerolineales bacterium]
MSNWNWGHPASFAGWNAKYHHCYAFLIIDAWRNVLADSFAVNGFFMRADQADRLLQKIPSVEAMLGGDKVTQILCAPTCDQSVTLRLWTGTGPVPNGEVG